MPSIAGSNILVIGGSSGIGAAVARLAATEGVQVSIASSNESHVHTAVQQIKDLVPNAQVAGYTCDVSQDDVETRLESLFSAVTEATGRPLDHVIYTAARVNFKPLDDVTIDFLRADCRFLTFVPIMIGKTAPRFMKKSSTSSLIFTSGLLADRPRKGTATLTTWASAIFGLTRALALELAPIRVNLVSPGLTDTEILGASETRAQIVAAAAQTALLGKVGAPEEVAEAYIYLMKDSNNTGSCVHTSGGSLLQ